MGLECQKYLGQGTFGCHSLSSLPFGCFCSPTNKSYSLQQAIHTQTSTALPSLCFMSSLVFLLFFLSPRGFHTALPHQNTKMTLEKAASQIKVTCLLVATGKCKQINNFILTVRVMSSLNIHNRNCMISPTATPSSSSIAKAIL